MRAYTVLSGLLLFLLLIAGGLSMLNRYLMMSRVQATPAAISVSTQAPEAKPTDQPGAMPHEDGTPIKCPTDSEDWSLSPTYASRTYNVIQPACVYQGLEKTIAWALAVREGYSRAEATKELGFSEMPMRQVRQVTIPEPTRDWLRFRSASFHPILNSVSGGSTQMVKRRLHTHCEVVSAPPLLLAIALKFGAVIIQ